MKFDLSAFRYLSVEDFRVLTAIEMGMRNHEIVPVELIDSIAKLKRTSVSRVIANLLKHKLIEHSNIKYDGYSLNFLGYDFLAIHTLMKRGILVKIGPKLGVGKESDVYICYVNAKNVQTPVQEISEEEFNKLKKEVVEGDVDTKNVEENSQDSKDSKDGEDFENKINDGGNVQDDMDTMMNKFEEELNILDIQCHIAIIKIARLGRTSFRAVKNKRDYVKNKSHYNWLYLSRLSAMNEFKFLSGLYQSNFSVPRPYGHNRHVILMQYIPSYPLCRIDDLGNKEKAYNDLISIITSLASKGLIHGDFNEFNILVRVQDQKIFFIDFPQMISIAHEDAEKYLLRDVLCINKFFKKKFGITFENSQVDFKEILNSREDFLDYKLKAYGYEKVQVKEEIEQLDVEEEEEISEEQDKEEVRDLDLEFKHEEIKGEAHSEKIEISSHSIKMKVKRMLEKKSSHGNRKTNRFKEKKKEKIEI